MSTFDPRAPNPRNPVPATGGVRVIVRDVPPPEQRPEVPSQPKEPEREEVPAQRAIVFPAGQSKEDRDAFVKSLADQWGRFIEGEIARRTDIRERSRKDVRQVVLMVLTREYEKQQGPPEHVPAFLHRVIENAAMTHAQLKKLDVDDGADVDAQPVAGLSPESAAHRAEQWARLVRYLGMLTEVEREAFVARQLQGLTLDAAAAALDRSPTAVREADARAMRKLQDLAAESDQATARGDRRR
jgi:RNA polymerase sigma-70 factor (ECF subfamily)